MTNAEAYKNAYNCQNMKQNSIYTEAGKLALKPEIQEYIRTLQKPMLEAVNISNLSARDKQITFIEERIQHCKELEDEQSVIRYTDMLNKIHGLYKDTDSGNDGKDKLNLENINTDSLFKLIG